MQYPKLANHFLTYPLPRPSQPVLNIPATPSKPSQPVANLIPTRTTIPPPKPHSKEAPNWALAPDCDEIGTIQAQTSQHDFSSKTPHRGDPPNRPYTRIRESNLRAATPEPRRLARDRRVHLDENTKESGRPENVQYRDAASFRRPSPIHVDVSQAVDGYHNADVTTAQIKSVENPAVLNPTGPAIAHDSGKEWDLLFSDPWAEHLNSAHPGPLLPQGCENTIPCQDHHKASKDSPQQTKGGAGIYHQQQAKTVSMATRKHRGDPVEMMSMLNVVDNNQQIFPYPDRLPFREIPSNNIDISQRYSRDQKQVLTDLRHLSLLPSLASNITRDPSFYSDMGHEWLAIDQHGEDDWLPAVPVRTCTSQSQASHYTSTANMSQTRAAISGRDLKRSIMHSGLDYCVSAARFKDESGLAIIPSVNDKHLSTCEMTPQSVSRASVKVSGYRRSLPLPSQFEAYQDACGRQYQPSPNLQPHRIAHHHDGRETRSPRRAIDDEPLVMYW